MSRSIRTLLEIVALAMLAATSAWAQESPAPPSEGAGAPPLTAADVDVWLDGYLPYAIKTGDIAGSAIVIVKDGQILTERGYGYADVAQRVPVDPKQTLFRTGSVSKLFTWTAVMQLVEQGKIDLDADVNRYLDFQIPPRDGAPVTLRNLMQHTAGFEERYKGFSVKSVDATTLKSRLTLWIPERIYPPGTTPAYSNYGAALAGYIVQRVSGERFETYIERHILAPLQMTHSTFRQPLPPELAPLMSKGYQSASGPPGSFEMTGVAPAGAFSATAEDMAHFMIAHLHGGEYHGSRILSAATVATMHDSPLTLLPPLNRAELGFFESNINGLEVIGHNGDIKGFHAGLQLFARENVGLYISFNSSGKERAAQSLRTALFEDFADRYFPSRPQPPGSIDAKTAALHAAMLTGNWMLSVRSQSNFQAVLGLVSPTSVGLDRHGGLSLGLPGKPRHWVEVAPFVWRDANGHDRLAARVVDGKVVRFSVDAISPSLVFERMPWYQNSGWLRPVLFASLAVLLLSALQWPIAAAARRYYGARLTLESSALWAYRLSRIGAVAILAAAAAWMSLFGALMANTVGDLQLRCVELFGILAFIGGPVLMALNLRAVWRGKPGWLSRVWSVALTLAGISVLWVAVAFKLIGLSVGY